MSIRGFLLLAAFAGALITYGVVRIGVDDAQALERLGTYVGGVVQVPVLIAIVLTLLMQNRTLALQGKALELQRQTLDAQIEELKESRQQFQRQADALAQTAMQSRLETFFALKAKFDDARKGDLSALATQWSDHFSETPRFGGDVGEFARGLEIARDNLYLTEEGRQKYVSFVKRAAVEAISARIVREAAVIGELVVGCATQGILERTSDYQDWIFLAGLLGPKRITRLPNLALPT